MWGWFIVTFLSTPTAVEIEFVLRLGWGFDKNDKMGIIEKLQIISVIFRQISR